MKEKCPKCGSGVQVIEGAYKRFECRSAMWGDEIELDHQSDDCKHRAELTKLKSDVERLRGALANLPFELLGKGKLDELDFADKAAIDGALRNAARALEETK